MAKLLLKLIPTETIAALIAEYITKALSKIDNKEKAQAISIAVAACSNAVNICAEAVKDCEVTEGEVNQITDGVKTAITAIVEAAK